MSAGSSINVVCGTVSIENGKVLGTITDDSGGVGTTTITKIGGQIGDNANDTANVTLTGTQDSFTQSDGSIEGATTISMKNSGITYRNSFNNQTNGKIIGNATSGTALKVTMTEGGNTFSQSGNNASITEKVEILITRNASTDRTLAEQLNNVLNVSDASWIADAGGNKADAKPTITMQGGLASINQFGSSKINGTTTITTEGAYYSINALGQREYTGNKYTQSGTASVNENVQVFMKDGHSTYELTDSASVNSGILTGGVDGDGVRVSMTEGDNRYLQHGSSSINSVGNSETIISFTGGSNSLYGMYESATINQNTTIDLKTAENNRFHMFYTTGDTDGVATSLKIADNSTVNMDQGSSEGNYFLMEAGTISSRGALVNFAAGTNDGNVINMNGAGTNKNVFTQLGGRVSYAGQNSGTTVKDTAKINLNGEKSTLNIFELSTTNDVDNAAYNDYTVYIGSNDSVDATNNTSIHGIYHQDGGRKNNYVTITGGQNLFWVSGYADYDADTVINPGSGTVTGNNVAVIDLKPSTTPGTQGHSLLSSRVGSNLDTVHTTDPAFTGTLDMSNTKSGSNNIFLANGDVYGDITTSGEAASGSKSVTNVYVGYVNEDSGNNQGYNWYYNNDYDLTKLSSGVIPNNGDTHAGPELGPYFGMSYINQTANNHLEVKSILGGGGDMHVQVTAGNAYNIKGIVGAADDVIDAGMFNVASGSLPYNYPYMISNLIYREGFAANASAKYSWIYQGTTSPGALPTNTNHDYRDFRYTTHFSNDRNYQVYSVLNQDLVNVGAYVDDRNNGAYLFHSPTNVTIGAITDKWTLDNSYGAIDLSSTTEFMPVMWSSNGTVLRDNHTTLYYDNPANYGPHTYSEFYKGKQAQITAGMVNVYAGSKLTIHQNFDATDASLVAFNQSDENDARRNIIDNLNIIGAPDENEEDCEDCGYTTKADHRAIVTLDRTTIHTLTDGVAITHYQDRKNAGYTTRDSITSNVVVGTNGILQGFGEFKSATDHSPKHANVIGDVAVLAGGMIRPYDGAVQDEVTGEQTSGIFVMHGNALSGKPGYSPTFSKDITNLMGVTMKIDGKMYFESMSRLSTRLFAVEDGDNVLRVISDGRDTTIGNDRYTPLGEIATVRKYWGDSLEVTKEIDFNEVAYSSIYLQNGVFNPFSPAELAAGVSSAGEPIASLFNKRIGDLSVWQGVSQHHKVQYVPTFGFVNELYSKLNYQIYRGDDQTGEQTYYYQVLYADSGADRIAALEGMPDANHIFNRDILFSDMLGNWSFEKQDGGKGVVLRFRQLAKHPQDGGIAIEEKIRNSREVALKLDEIRYPFLTAYNMADSSLQGLFHADPSLDGDTTADGQSGVKYETPYQNGANNEDPYYAYGGNPYDRSGFDGDIETYYRDNQDRFSNYRDVWVKDISNYLHALQLNLGSASEIHHSLRLLSAEPYASQASADLQAMNMFIGSRERNGVSAMFLVEKNKEPQPDPDPDNYYGNFVDPIAKDAPAGYVDNPTRFWATALGYHTYRDGMGDEYGFDTHASGMQIGSIKEKGDIYYGVTAGYTRSRNSWEELQAVNHTDNYMGEAIFGIHQDFGFVEGHVNYGESRHRMVRDLTQGSYLNGGEYDAYMDCDTTDNYFNGVYQAEHTGKYTSLTRGGGLRVGMQKVFFGKWLFLPTLGVRYMDVRNKDAFTEKGKDIDAFRLVFGKGAIKRKSLQIPAMVRISRSIGFNNGGPTIITPELRLGATVECLDRNGKIENFKWIGNPIPNRYMKAWGLKEDRVQYQVGATIEVSRRGRFYAAVNYDLHFDDSFSSYNHSFSLQSGINF